MSEAEQLLWKFFNTWVECESTRGCYSCCEEHDCRCPKAFGKKTEVQCVCGRDEINGLEVRLMELQVREKRSQPKG